MSADLKLVPSDQPTSGLDAEGKVTQARAWQVKARSPLDDHRLFELTLRVDEEQGRAPLTEGQRDGLAKLVEQLAGAARQVLEAPPEDLKCQCSGLCDAAGHRVIDERCGIHGSRR